MEEGGGEPRPRRTVIISRWNIAREFPTFCSQAERVMAIGVQAWRARARDPRSSSDLAR